MSLLLLCLLFLYIFLSFFYPAFPFPSPIFLFIASFSPPSPPLLLSFSSLLFSFSSLPSLLLSLVDHCHHNRSLFFLVHARDHLFCLLIMLMLFLFPSQQDRHRVDLWGCGHAETTTSHNNGHLQLFPSIRHAPSVLAHEMGTQIHLVMELLAAPSVDTMSMDQCFVDVQCVFPGKE